MAQALNLQTTVLVVDDEQTILENLVDLLEVSGYRVLCATNGAEALELMASQAPDAIISDIMMHEMNGYDFYWAVRGNPAWTLIPFIFLTARGQVSDIRYATGLGADHYIVKPFEPTDLLVALESRLKRMRDARRAAEAGVEQMKQRFLTLFSHELRTPLSTVYGYASMLREEHTHLSEDEIDEMLAGMHRGAVRLARLVEDLMLMVRIESGAAAFEVERLRARTDMVPLIFEVVRDFSVKAEARHVRLQIQAPRELMGVFVPAYAKDALARLVDNAIKFSKPEGGTVELIASSHNGKIAIAVQDHGIGVHPARFDQLFQQFEQIDRQTMEQQGMGLGLTIAQSLARLQGGEIAVQSQPDAGSTFTLLLPRS